MTSTFAGLVLGLAIGLRHAFEPDHLTAMATLVADTRDPRRGALLGALWGLGHTLSLVVVGAVLIALDVVLPARVAVAFELAVGAVLIVLGLRAVIGAWTGAVRTHAHGARLHRHGGPNAHVHVGGWMLAWRPLAVGIVHGLAGSGALTALVFARLPSTVDRIAYIAVFGAGSIAGMAITSAIVGASLGALARGHRWLTLAAGTMSIGLGIAWSVPLVGQL